MTSGRLRAGGFAGAAFAGSARSATVASAGCSGGFFAVTPPESANVAIRSSRLSFDIATPVIGGQQAELDGLEAPAACA
jgi:hypothetical protein